MSERRPRNLVATRSALLDAARLAFTRYGYEAAGVREIAESADVDRALITRYFGSKEGLFAEAVPAMFDPAPLLDGDRASFGERAVRHLLTHGRGEGFDPTIALLRSLSDISASNLLRAGLEKRLVEPLAAWLGGKDADLHATVLVAQIAGLELMMNVLPLSAFAIDAERLVTMLAPILQQIVDKSLETAACPVS